MQSEARKLVGANVFELRGTEQGELPTSIVEGTTGPIIATGCPYSGWDMALPLLRQAGLESVDASRFNQEFFQGAGIADPLQLRIPVHPEEGVFQQASRFLPETKTAPMMFADSRNLWLLDFWASMWADARFLLFYTREESALAHAVQEGLDPLYFLEGWKAASRQLLSFQRRNRKRVLLLDAEAASRQPDEMIKICRQFGIPVQPLSHKPALALPGSMLERLLAGQLLAAQSDKHNLSAELEASAHPMGDTEIQVKPEPFELFNDYMKRRASERKLLRHLGETDEKFQAAGRTLELQHEKNRQLQVSHEQALQELDTRQSEEIGRFQWYLGERDAEINRQAELIGWLERQVGEVKGEINRRIAEIGPLNQALSEKERDLDLVRSELRQTLETVEQLTRSRDQQTGEMAEFQVRLEQVQKAKQALEAANQEVARENDLLLLQLHQVQEELETTFLKKQELEQSRIELEKQRTAQVEQLTKASKDQEKLAAERLDQLEKLRKEQAGRQQEWQKQIDQLSKAKDEQTKLAAQNKTELQKLRQANQTLEATGKETARENELLLLQLHQVQEELEIIFLQKQRLEQEQKERAVELQAQMKQHHMQFKQSLLAKDQEVEEQRRRLARIKQSASWKITAPVRAVVKPFKGSAKNKVTIKKQVQLLKSSGLFDEKWYRAEYPDVAQSGTNPFEHYLRFGAAEGRNPSPAFNTYFYLQTNPDVAESGLNPLVHYVKFGKAENRQAC
jgi:hypothetical protein